MEKLKEDAERIKSLQIQGATNVALSAINYLSSYAKRLTVCSTPEEYLVKLKEAKDILFNTRATEPAMRNGLNYIINKLEKNKDEINQEFILKSIDRYKNEYKQMIHDSKEKIAQIGARRIPSISKTKADFIVMTHCHSSTVTGILLKAKEQGKSFKVINTQTQPKLQGRKTARELTKAGIEIKHVVDSAIRWAVNHYEVDLILIGADSITSEGTILNKIGSRLLALVAHEEHVPFYVATPLLKYNPETSFGILEKIEMRDPKEIWEEPPDNVEVLNPAFETVSRRYIDGLISEAGIFASSHVSFQFARLYPDLL